MRYLLVTHIPFAALPSGGAMLDGLWYEDLLGLTAAFGTITVAAPALSREKLAVWGTGLAECPPGSPISFVPLPAYGGRLDLLFRWRTRSALKAAVAVADLVHTSNFFGHDVALYSAHDQATRLGKKTLFVVAEDFVDMLTWEWVRTAPSRLQRWRRVKTLHKLHRHIRQRVQTASLVFLHTPAAVSRYRLDAGNARAIRQPLHEITDVIPEDSLAKRNTELHLNEPLRLVTASRLQPLKGLDFAIRAVHMLRDRGVPVELTLYGRGPQEEELRKLIARLELTEAVHLAGAAAPGQPMREALAAGHVFLMPHLTNDFGRAFFDAISAGLPVVAFRSEASEDTVRHELDGLLVPNLDIEALASALARLACDRHFTAQLSVRARERALQNTRSFWNELRTGWIRELFE